MLRFATRVQFITTHTDTITVTAHGIFSLLCTPGAGGEVSTVQFGPQIVNISDRHCNILCFPYESPIEVKGW